jgi:hypothetical protein
MELRKLFPFKSFWKNLLLYTFTLGLIGPVLSFFTLQTQAGYGTERALLYAVVSFIADLLSILMFAKVYSRFAGSFEEVALESLAAYLPMWLFDVFDAYQPLRFLSNLGLLVSVLVLNRFMGKRGLTAKVRLTLITLWVVLYALDGFLSELIAASPLTKLLLNLF